MATQDLGQYNAAIRANGLRLNANEPLVAATATIASLTVGSGTAVASITKYTPSLTPASTAANTTAEQTFTVTGLATGQTVIVNGPAVTAGTGIVNARVSAANTLALTFSNNTAGALTPAAGTYTVIAIG